MAARRGSARTAAIPWYVWCCVAAMSSSVIGGVWDISWHESVGRDTFWTPAHMLIYLCGVLAGISCGYLILSTTLQKNSPMREASISMWGFRGPLGAFICAWGGVAMITSAPFDNWWHEAYGLDVKILSPPHILLALGMTAIRFGTLVMVVAAMNRAQGEYRARLERVLFYAFVFLLAMTIGIAQELTNRVYMHGAKFYVVVMLGLPDLAGGGGARVETPLGGDHRDGHCTRRCIWRSCGCCRSCPRSRSSGRSIRKSRTWFRRIFRCC